MRLTDLLKAITGAVRSSTPGSARPASTQAATQSSTRASTQASTRASTQATESERRGVGEYDVRTFGAPRIAYAPDIDGDPDPGEVVWGWVPYEEDPNQGKDRPLLIVGACPGALVALQLTSKDRADEGLRRDGAGRLWLDVGTGGWDRKHRPSEVRLDRVLRVETRAVRREGSALDRARFDQVVLALQHEHGW